MEYIHVNSFLVKIKKKLEYYHTLMPTLSIPTVGTVVD